MTSWNPGRFGAVTRRAFLGRYAGGLGTLTGDMDFVLGATGGDVSGTGTFTEVITGNATTLTVDPATPLHIEIARGTSNSVANACASSLDGDLSLDVDGPTGSMTSTWSFQNTRKPARLMNASFNDGTDTTSIPDADVTVPCGQSGSPSDWNGTFNQQWYCIPPEFGSATLTLSVSGNQINITDEDPPSSGQTATYSASVVSGNPHVGRSNAIMAGQVKPFKNAELKAMADYLAKLPGDVHLVPNAKFHRAL